MPELAESEEDVVLATSYAERRGLRARISGDRLFKLVTLTPTLVVLGLLIGITAVLVWSARESIAKFGLQFVVSSDWDPVNDQFGALPFSTIDGTYASTFEFFMGSTLAHLILLTFIGIGLLNRARLGRYDGGRWYQLRLIRVFAVWIAASVCILALVMSLFT